MQKMQPDGHAFGQDSCLQEMFVVFCAIYGTSFVLKVRSLWCEFCGSSSDLKMYAVLCALCESSAVLECTP